MDNLKNSLLEHFLIISKKLIVQSGLTLEKNCESDFRYLLSNGLDMALQNKVFITPLNEADFLKSSEFISMEANVIRFVSGWINDAKKDNETTLHESTLRKFRNWFDKTFCPGFIPFC